MRPTDAPDLSVTLPKDDGARFALLFVLFASARPRGFLGRGVARPRRVSGRRCAGLALGFVLYVSGVFVVRWFLAPGQESTAPLNPSKSGYVAIPDTAEHAQ